MEKESTKGVSAEKSRQMVTFDEKELPAIEGWRVNEEYTIELKVKEVSQKIGDEYFMSAEGKRGKPTMSATFEIISATARGNNMKSKMANSPKMATLKEKLDKY